MDRSPEGSRRLSGQLAISGPGLSVWLSCNIGPGFYCEIIIYVGKRPFCRYRRNSAGKWLGGLLKIREADTVTAAFRKPSMALGTAPFLIAPAAGRLCLALMPGTGR